MENKDMTLNEMSQIVDKYIGQFEEGYFSPLALLASLSEEVGELAKEINHFYGEKPKRKGEDENTVGMELADCLFILLCFANALDIDLNQAFIKMMDKFNIRDKDRWTKKE
ncbi:nucleotide pyrophosphohydrolase [Serpentinicella alkaliphila]|uniref:NTP pyrophosphatase (Non-canonical NTP hydrolase) n=1 Tax=Serpentinicella alkaliphila TaxID=1734049 RepID=A0A4R2T8Y3_9FIRM|nr:nucleotide pyrophosphohydrolase [Serpentinicella alkaliphila]QUH25503.1 nucleotide pyrophosphohydrolase [Serpentinicella alkaliphila]TCP99689.1 NTP pyrophosphatase (non-canonical NTP hydrolase) [Serpentinicella alkaliphila]